MRFFQNVAYDGRVEKYVLIAENDLMMNGIMILHDAEKVVSRKRQE